MVGKRLLMASQGKLPETKYSEACPDAAKMARVREQGRKQHLGGGRLTQF